MILYYAMGGGLGHLSRAHAVLHSLRVQGLLPPEVRSSEAVLLTSSPFALDSRVARGAQVCQVPTELGADSLACRAFVQAQLFALQPSLLLVDSFPGGIIGELCDLVLPPHTTAWHIARLLKLPAYQPLLRGVLPHYQRTFMVEQLVAAHLNFLSQCSGSVENLHVDDPQALQLSTEMQVWLQLRQRPFWLVVHSESGEELAELLAYAQAHRARLAAQVDLVLVSPKNPNSQQPSVGKASVQGQDGAAFLAAVEHVDIYPAAGLFPHAQRIYSACGWNVMQQTQAHRARHFFLPQPRRFDDQFLRAARRRAETSG